MKHQKDGGTYVKSEVKNFDLGAFLGFPARATRMASLRCSKCGDQVIGGPAIERALEEAARALLTSDSRLSAAQAVFLRKQMGLTQEALAAILSINRVTIAKWEKAKPGSPKAISPDNDFRVRMFYLKHLATQSKSRVQDLLEKTVRIRPEQAHEAPLVVGSDRAA